MDFKVNISPVTDPEVRLKFLLFKLLYKDETNSVEGFLMNGGTIKENLDEETAGKMVQELNDIGINAEALEKNENSQQNNLPSGYFIGAEEDKKQISLKTPGGNKLIVSDLDNSFILEDVNGNKIIMSAEGITISSTNNLNLKASGNLIVDATNIEMKGNAELKLNGSAGVEISSSGITSIQGSLIQIN